MNPIDFLPDEYKKQIIDGIVDVIVSKAGGRISKKNIQIIKGLKSDRVFTKEFTNAIQRATQRFLFENNDESAKTFLSNSDLCSDEKFIKALTFIVSHPGSYSEDEYDVIFDRFSSIYSPSKSISETQEVAKLFLTYLTNEIWKLPEFREIYSVYFQILSFEMQKKQNEMQVAQNKALIDLNEKLKNPMLFPLPIQDCVKQNLPQPDYGTFVGRSSQLEDILDKLRPYPKSQHAIVAIDGIGGVGKSALALEVAHHFVRHFDDISKEERFAAIIWISAKHTKLTINGLIPLHQNLRTLEDIYRTIAISLGRDDITRLIHENSIKEVVINAITLQRTLLIIDNLETVDDDDEVLNFLGEIPGPTKTIITTRNRIDVPKPIRLEGLEPPEASKLITNEAERKGVDINDQEKIELGKLTNGIPLAIVLSIGRISSNFSIATVLNNLRKADNDISRYCFIKSVESIESENAYTVLLTLSIFATEASREALGCISAIQSIDMDEGLVKLGKLSLINRRGDHFTILPLIKNFAASQLSIRDDIKMPLHLRYVKYFVNFVNNYGGEKSNLYHYLDDEIDNIKTAVEIAYSSKYWTELGELVLLMLEYLDRNRNWNLIIQYSEMALEAGRETNDHYLIMYIKQFGLGWVKIVRLDDQEAGFKSINQSREMAEELNNNEMLARCYYSEAIYYERKVNFDRALELLNDSLKIWKEIGNRHWELRLIGTIGGLESHRGNYSIACDFYKEGLKMARLDDNQEMIARNLSRLGRTLGLMGESISAQQYLEDSLLIYESQKLTYSVAVNYLWLAEVLEKSKEYERAYFYCSRAKDLFSTLGDIQQNYEKANALIERLKIEQ